MWKKRWKMPCLDRSKVAKQLGILEGRKVRRLDGALEGKRVGSLEDKLINVRSFGKFLQKLQFDNIIPSYPLISQSSNSISLCEILQKQQTDNILPSYPPTFLSSIHWRQL